MAVKSSLYRSSTSGQQRAADCHCTMMLNCIAITFKSLLRPKAVNSAELVRNSPQGMVELQWPELEFAVCVARANVPTRKRTRTCMFRGFREKKKESSQYKTEDADFRPCGSPSFKEICEFVVISANVLDDGNWKMAQFTTGVL